MRKKREIICLFTESWNERERERKRDAERKIEMGEREREGEREFICLLRNTLCTFLYSSGAQNS